MAKNRKPARTAMIPLADEPTDVVLADVDMSVRLENFVPNESKAALAAFLDKEAFFKPLFFDVLEPGGIYQVVSVQHEVTLLGEYDYDIMLLCSTISSERSRVLYQIPLTHTLRAQISEAKAGDYLLILFQGKVQSKLGRTVKEIAARILEPDEASALGLPAKCWGGRYWNMG